MFLQQQRPPSWMAASFWTRPVVILASWALVLAFTFVLHRHDRMTSFSSGDKPRETGGDSLSPAVVEGAQEGTVNATSTFVQTTFLSTDSGLSSKTQDSDLESGGRVVEHLALKEKSSLSGRELKANNEALEIKDASMDPQQPKDYRTDQPAKGERKRSGLQRQGVDATVEASAQAARDDRKAQLRALVEQTGARDLNDAIARLNSRFEALPRAEQPGSLLAWAAETFPEKRWAVVTSFGLSGVATLEKLRTARLLAAPLVLTIDTLHLFPETYQLIDKARDYWTDMELVVSQTKHANSKAAFQAKFGNKLWVVSERLYRYIVKVKPMREALEARNILLWTTGRRASQGGLREKLPLVELEEGEWRVKVNPFARWNFKDVEQFVKDSGAPYNSLLDKGYLSVGDMHSTDKTRSLNGTNSESLRERSGRFQGKKDNECGMHLPHSDSTVKNLRMLETRMLTAYTWEAKASKLSAENGVMTVTVDDFHEKIVYSKDSILLFVFSPMCPHCHKFQPQFVQLAASLAKDQAFPSLKFARMDGLQNRLPKGLSSAFSWKAFPTLYLAIQGNKMKPIKYSGARDPAAIRKWLGEKLPKSHARSSLL